MPPPLPSSFSHYTITALHAALQAGEILRRGFGIPCTITAKTGPHNVVTEYDYASEQAIIATIQQAFPHDSILAEESGLITPPSSATPYLWVIDPLDGTTNFSRHIPCFAVSIAVYQHDTCLCGVIFQPMTYELFIAERGCGSYLNGNRLVTSPIAHLEEAMCAINTPIIDHLALLFDQKTAAWPREKGPTLRNWGSAALALAYLASGKLDAVWMHDVYLWDCAAAALLVEEAGGTIYRYGKAIEQRHSPFHILGSNDPLHSTLLSSLSSAMNLTE